MTKLLLCIFLIATLWAQTLSPLPSPHVARFVAPAYPWKARAARMQGETATELQVRADGTVQSANVTMAHPFFRDYVEAALKQWEFEPTGRTFVQKVTVRFSLVDGCDDLRSSRPDAYRETRVQARLPSLVEVRTCPELIVTNTN
jgi:TonB family protein